MHMAILGRIARAGPLTLLVIVMAAIAVPQEASAQESTPELLRSPATGTQQVEDRAWCQLFTDDGTLMAIEDCERKVRLLFGDPSARMVPQSLVPMVIFLTPPDPAIRSMIIRGKGSETTEAFTIPAAASYRTTVRTNGCAGTPRLRLLGVGDHPESPGVSIGDGGHLFDMGPGDFSVKANTAPKTKKKPCTWRIRFEPVVAESYWDLDGYLNDVIIPVPEE